jgi:hypothetical protein
MKDEELLRETAELIPDRLVMRRHKGKRGRRLKPVCVRALEPSMPSRQGPCPDGYRIAYIRR